MARTLLLAAAFVILVAPAATAHTTVTTSDGQYFVTVGNLNEPVTTFTKTGLDLTIRQNHSGVRGPGIPGLEGDLTATLIAPNGEEMSEPLEGRFGSPGSYTFENPYYLTQPGESYLRLAGTINGSSANLERILVGSGPVPDMADTMFPDDVDSLKSMMDRIAALEAKHAQMEQRLSVMNSGTEAKAPGLGGLLTLAALGACVVLWVARRNDRA